MVVDDEDEVRRVLVELVRSRGYEVVEASNGDDAWSQLLNRPVDVVVSDLQMPQCDGRELCRRIRAKPSLRDIRVVIISGCDILPHEQELRCDRVLSKPIAGKALFRELELACSALDTVSYAHALSGLPVHRGPVA